MPRRVRENSLSLFFLAIFVAAAGGHALSGQDVYNQEELAHTGMRGEEPTRSASRARSRLRTSARR